MSLVFRDYVETALVGVAIFILIMHGAYLLFPISADINYNYTCETFEWIEGDVSLCRTSDFIRGENYMLWGGGAGRYNGTYFILIDANLPSWFEPYVLKHELCHVQQYRENRPPSEEECYIRMFL